MTDSTELSIRAIWDDAVAGYWPRGRVRRALRAARSTFIATATLDAIDERTDDEDALRIERRFASRWYRAIARICGATVTRIADLRQLDMFAGFTGKPWCDQCDGDRKHKLDCPITVASVTAVLGVDGFNAWREKKRAEGWDDT